MGRTFLLTGFCLAVAATLPASGETWYVAPPPSGSDSNPGTEQQPFATIQKGIDTASDADTVLVAQGTYYENVRFDGKNITLTSTDPLDPDIVAQTIIDGNQAGSVVTFSGTEDETCLLSGFTIRNGSAACGGGISGGTWDTWTHALISNNIIHGNSAEFYGGGLAYCYGDISNNAIFENSAGSEGGGIYSCDGEIHNNVIHENSALFQGGGLYDCDGTIRNNVIAANSATYGAGGLYDCDGTIQNNTIYRNWGGQFGGGLCYCRGTISNCIVWENSAWERPQIDSSSEPTFSCIQAWTGAGQGNTHSYPHFVDPDNGDFHLQSWSPCIDAGDPSSDFSNEPQPNGGRINMGAYGNTFEAASKSPDSDSDDLPDDWEMHWFANLDVDAAGDPDGDRILNITDYTYGWNPTAAAETLVENLTKGTCYQAIQPAILNCAEGDEIVVYPGVYRENIVLPGKNVVLRSTDPSHGDVVANTIIDGNQSASVVAFAGTEDETCLLSGFTIRNGMAQCGGGISGGEPGVWTRAVISNNVIHGNSARDYGGGLAYCHGDIRNNVIYDNSTAYLGGGMYDCAGTIRNNTICGNSVPSDGAGLGRCHGLIFNCIIWGNHRGSQLRECNVPTYCCIERWRTGGEGNFPYYPYFVDSANGDYHLESWSPCIDAGDPTSAFSEEPQPNGGRINMGAYGNTTQAASGSPDADQDALPDDWERKFFGELSPGPKDDPDADRFSNLDEYHRGYNPTTPPPVRHVDASVPTSGDGASWEAAFKTIQEAIETASDGDIVLVAQGTYSEQIDFRGKNIVLRSTDPLDPAVVAATVFALSAVTFEGTEDETCSLSGFTIRDGFGICGGAWGFREVRYTRATIEHNVICDNVGFCGEGTGGGIYGCHGTIQNNIICRNTAYAGGGLCFCGGTIQNNVIVQNYADYGGGISGWNGSIEDTVITGGIVQNNIIAWNSAEGGGLYRYHGMIQNNTIYGNTGGGINSCGGTIRNCIIWKNSQDQVSRSSTPTHSCIQGWTGGGAGNISMDPVFVDPDGPDDDARTWEDNDYHLRPHSPCINAGVNYYWFAWPQRDLDGNCRLASERVDMGCYEHRSSPDFDGDLLSDNQEEAVGTSFAQEDTDGDGLRDGLEILRGSNPLEATLPGIVRVPSDALTIQEALCFALNGDQIIVDPGTYRENLRFCGADLILRGSPAETASAIGSTIIDCGGAGSAVSFTGAETEACVLSGFVITGGDAYDGGGIYGGLPQGRTHATVQNNVIIGNRAPRYGGGVAYCDGIIQNNTICGNYGHLWGGGLYSCWGSAIRNCVIWANTSWYGSDPYMSCTTPTYSCPGDGEGSISLDPQFVDPDGPDDDPKTYEDNDYRLLPTSPCIDAGYNDPELPETDIAGMHRIMYGGKSLTVDMGAYEYYVNSIEVGSWGIITLTWSSLSGKTYSIYFSSDMMTWQIAADNVLSMGDAITAWLDPTGPLLSPEVKSRYYSVLENE